MHLSRLLPAVLLPAVLLLGLFASPPLRAQAEALASPYTVVVPVADTTDAQRNDAFASALAQVLTRVAGGQDLRSNAGYADALQGASSIVQKFQYQRAADGMSLQVDFEPGAVKRMVSRLGVKAAGVKPPVLLLVRGTDGVLLDKAALASLAAAAAARGTDVTYPDAGVTTDFAKIAAGDPTALAALTQRYRTGLVLLGTMRAGSADWTLITGSQPQKWSDQGSTEDALFADAGASVAARVSKQLNVVGGSVSNGKLWVSGLHLAVDYAGLLAALRADPAVRDVDTIGAQDDGVMLDVKAALPMSGLAANLAASGRVRLQATAHPGADVTLVWVH
ncbi:MAG: DUF2066 domain-containing protein [Rhodanobacter sp.]